MIETVLVCHHTHRRQPVGTVGELPGSWLAVDGIVADGVDLADLHFASWSDLAAWATAQEARSRLPRPVSFLERHGIPA